MSSFCNSTIIPTGGTAYSSTPASSSPVSSSSPVAPVSTSPSSSVPASTSSAPYPAGTSSAVIYPSGSGISYPPYPPSGTAVPSFPPCWSQCFGENHVTAERALCYPPTGPAVSGCVDLKCNATAIAGYGYWLKSYCNATIIPTGGSTAPSSSAPAVTSSSPVAPVSVSSSTPVTSSVSSSTPYPVSSSSSLPYPIGTGSGRPAFPTGTSVPSFPACWVSLKMLARERAPRANLAIVSMFR